MIKWIEKEHKYGPYTLNGHLGDVKLFYIRWNAVTSHKEDESRKYICSCQLPGINSNFFGSSEEVCKEKANEILCRWLKITGLTDRRE